MKGFFKIESIPGVMFLNGTSFKDCKLINNNLTLKEYNKAIGKKSEKIILSDKKDKTKKTDKSRILDKKIDNQDNRFDK